MIDQNQTQLPNSTPTTPEVKKSNKTSWLKWILIGFVIVDVLLAFAYFYFLANTGKSTPQPTPTVAATPTPDPTANWGVYNNTKIGFEISYPSNTDTPTYTKGPNGGSTYNVDGTEGNEVMEFPGNSQNYRNAYLLEIFPFTGNVEQVINTPKKYEYSGTTQAIRLEKKFKVANKDTLWYKRIEPPTRETYEIFMVARNYAFVFHSGPDTSEEQMELILSTFKFTDQEQSQVACTQDAKLCPDGSSVGRTGPNCEFVPCPTP